jgi:MoaA/NifB/PqqE/SkfB family radical SAM enzyme
VAGAFIKKVVRYAKRKVEARVGGLIHPVEKTLDAMALRPSELHLELTNICNADCVFCCYQFQERPQSFMSDEVFYRAVDDFCRDKGGSVGLTPIVGDALVDPKFLERLKYIRSRPEIDRIFLTTNAILLDKFGIEEVLKSGLTTINISTSGFDKESYKRIYRSPAYERMRKNVTDLVEANARLGNPVNITICIRTDRPLSEVMADPDFQPILKHKPHIDFTLRYGSVGKRITTDMLLKGMTLKPPCSVKKEPCGSLYTGIMVLTDGTALACACVVAMDSAEYLGLGNVKDKTLRELFTGPEMQKLRDEYKAGNKLNPVCDRCDAYMGLEMYRLKEGRVRAELNIKRASGQVVKRADKANVPFAGG